MQFPTFDERAFIAAEKYFRDHAEEYVAGLESDDLKETLMSIFIDGWTECMKINRIWEN